MRIERKHLPYIEVINGEPILPFIQKSVRYNYIKYSVLFQCKEIGITSELIPPYDMERYMQNLNVMIENAKRVLRPFDNHFDFHGTRLGYYVNKGVVVWYFKPRSYYLRKIKDINQFKEIIGLIIEEIKEGA